MSFLSNINKNKNLILMPKKNTDKNSHDSINIYGIHDKVFLYINTVLTMCFCWKSLWQVIFQCGPTVLYNCACGWNSQTLANYMLGQKKNMCVSDRPTLKFYLTFFMPNKKIDWQNPEIRLRFRVCFRVQQFSSFLCT